MLHCLHNLVKVELPILRRPLRAPSSRRLERQNRVEVVLPSKVDRRIQAKPRRLYLQFLRELGLAAKPDMHASRRDSEQDPRTLMACFKFDCADTPDIFEDYIWFLCRTRRNGLNRRIGRNLAFCLICARRYDPTKTLLWFFPETTSESH